MEGVERYEPFASLGLATVAGLLIGLERERSRPVDEKRGFLGGIRTYPLIAVIGAVTVLLVPTLGPWPLVASALALGLLMAISYWRDSEQGHAGITTEVSAFLTLLLGAVSAASDLGALPRRVFIVSAIAVVATMLLSLKVQLRQFSARVSNEDVIATLKFLVVAVVLLPMLPDEARGPYGVLNPFHIGVMVVLIAGIGFVGYVAIRLVGPGRGLLLTGAVGGLVSSTAVTLASANRARHEPSLAGLSALSTVLASTIMFPRLLAILAAIDRPLMNSLTVPLGGMAVVGLGAVALLYWRSRVEPRSSPTVHLTNPFELSSALKFGGLFVVVLLVSRWAQETFGTGGAYVTGLLAGATDVDAISLSMANMAKSGQVELGVARTTIVLATCSNTAVKAILSLALGGWPMGRQVLLGFGAVLATGLVLLFLT